MGDTKLGTTGLAIHQDKFVGIYRGKVLDNNDPEFFGRVKIQIYPMFADITDATLLPWSVPAMGLFDGAGNGTGAFAVPKIGTFVYVFFEQGDMYQPVYFAEAQTAQKGLPLDRLINYPNSKVWRTSSGTEISIDDTLNRVILLHPTGSFIVIDTLGNITIRGTNIYLNPL